MLIRESLVAKQLFCNALRLLLRHFCERQKEALDRPFFGMRRVEIRQERIRDPVMRELRKVLQDLNVHVSFAQAFSALVDSHRMFENQKASSWHPGTFPRLGAEAHVGR